MRPAAQVDEVIARAVRRQNLVFGQILDELDLELLILEKFERRLLGNLLALPIFLALQDFLHLLLDGLEVVVRRWARQQEVVVEAVGNLRPDGVLRLLAEDFDNSLCKHMRQRVAVDVQELFFIHDVSPLLDICAGTARMRRAAACTVSSIIEQNVQSVTKVLHAGIRGTSGGLDEEELYFDARVSNFFIKSVDSLYLWALRVVFVVI